MMKEEMYSETLKMHKLENSNNVVVLYNEKQASNIIISPENAELVLEEYKNEQLKNEYILEKMKIFDSLKNDIEINF